RADRRLGRLALEPGTAAGREDTLGDLFRVQWLACFAQDVDRDLLGWFALAGCCGCHGDGLLLLVAVGRRCGEEDPQSPNICRARLWVGPVRASVSRPLVLGPAPDRAAGRAVDAAHVVSEMVEAVLVRHGLVRAAARAASQSGLSVRGAARTAGRVAGRLGCGAPHVLSTGGRRRAGWCRACGVRAGVARR